MATPIPVNHAEFTAYSAALATGGCVHAGGREEVLVRGITTDSRAVVEGGAFVALRGEKHDGHSHVRAALDRGAGLVVVARGRGEATPAAVTLEVDDTLVAWGALARAHLRAWRRARAAGGVAAVGAKVICITGSAGKTTTKELTLALLSRVAPTLATHGNLNNRIGLPAMAFTAEPLHAFAVLEAGMSLRGEIAALAHIAEPDVAVITNVGVAHAAGVGGTRADVAREKGALVASLGSSGVAVVNADDDAAMGTLSLTRASSARTFGRSASASYRLLDRVSRGTEGSRITFERPCEACATPHARETLEVEIPLVGEVAAIDFLAALAAVEAVHGTLDIDAIWDGMSEGMALGGRASILSLADGTTLIDDAYNANPDSMRAAIQTLAELARSKRARSVAIVGEMKELGPLADHEHDVLGDRLADAGIVLVIGTGGLAERTLDRAEARGLHVVRGASSKEAARLAQREVQPGDVVLVKASRSVSAEAVVEALVAARGRGGMEGVT